MPSARCRPSSASSSAVRSHNASPPVGCHRSHAHRRRRRKDMLAHQLHHERLPRRLCVASHSPCASVLAWGAACYCNNSAHSRFRQTSPRCSITTVRGALSPQEGDMSLLCFRMVCNLAVAGANVMVDGKPINLGAWRDRSQHVMWCLRRRIRVMGHGGTGGLRSPASAGLYPRSPPSRSGAVCVFVPSLRHPTELPADGRVHSVLQCVQ